MMLSVPTPPEAEIQSERRYCHKVQWRIARKERLYTDVPEEEKCKQAYNRYINVLTEIKDYVKELRKQVSDSSCF